MDESMALNHPSRTKSPTNSNAQVFVEVDLEGEHITSFIKPKHAHQSKNTPWHITHASIEYRAPRGPSN
jgi:hypothetical protein